MDTKYKGVNNNDDNGPYFWRQLFVCLTTTTFFFMIGLTLGSPTVALPQLRKEANLTKEESIDRASWINSIVPYTAIFWVLILIILANYIGRRKPMIIMSLSSLAGYILFYYSKNFSQLFIAQMIQGLTQASFSTTCFMVVLEYTTPRYRGLFLGFFSATHFWGIWVANTIGLFCNYRYIGLVGVACAVYTLIAFVFIPESPYWLACQERYEECRTVHRWLKGVGEEAEKELNALINSRKDLKKTISTTKKSSRDHMNRFVEILKGPSMYKPILLICVTSLGYQLSGKLACAVYAVEIMKKITKTESEAIIGVLILDGFSVVGMYVGCFLSRYFRRRTLLIRASVVCAVFLFILSFYLFLVNYSIVSENSYISITLLVVFSLAACIGPIIAANQIIAELYPIKHRSIAMCFICVMNKFIYGSTLKMTPYIFKQFNDNGAFLFFAVSFTVCLTLWYYYIPETKDKTIQDISEMMANNRLEQSNKTKLLSDNTAV